METIEISILKEPDVEAGAANGAPLPATEEEPVASTSRDGSTVSLISTVKERSLSNASR
jgi:hypothetical protein